MPLTGPTPDRIADTLRFHALLSRISERNGGYRYLAACDGRMEWPRRGVYFFFEPGETRNDPDGGLRVVRVGTHALTPESGSGGTSLWTRLSQHRGNARSGTGNHRKSVFRQLVGAALARRGDTPLPPGWKEKARTQSTTVEEAGLERRVSDCIGRMPFLWFGIDDPPGPASLRGVIERNAIALLSHARTPAADPPSDRWLGWFSDREKVRVSGLWNNQHVAKPYDPSFLDRMDMLATRWCE